jgi:hypothetical protein
LIGAVKTGVKNNKFVLTDRRHFLFSLFAAEAGDSSAPSFLTAAVSQDDKNCQKNFFQSSYNPDWSLTALQ